MKTATFLHKREGSLIPVHGSRVERMIAMLISWILKTFLANAPKRRGCILGTVVFRGKERVFLGVFSLTSEKFFKNLLGARVPTPANYPLSPPMPSLCPLWQSLCPICLSLCPFRLSLCRLRQSLCPEGLIALSTARFALLECPFAPSPGPNRSPFGSSLFPI